MSIVTCLKCYLLILYLYIQLSKFIFRIYERGHMSNGTTRMRMVLEGRGKVVGSGANSFPSLSFTGRLSNRWYFPNLNVDYSLSARASVFADSRAHLLSVVREIGRHASASFDWYFGRILSPNRVGAISFCLFSPISGAAAAAATRVFSCFSTTQL